MQSLKPKDCLASPLASKKFRSFEVCNHIAMPKTLPNMQPAKRRPGPGGPRKSIERHILEGTLDISRHRERLQAEVSPFPPKPRKTVRASARSQSRWVHNESDQRAVRNGCRFNEALAQHAVDFFAKFLAHSKGQWTGKPFDLLGWQRDDLIYPLFGWVRKNSTRRFRCVYVEIPKKNGKSTIASAIGLYMLCAEEEPGAEVYSMASDRDQASIVHGEAINMVDALPALSAVIKLNRSTKCMSHLESYSSYKAASSKAAGKEGINIHCGIIDELHVWQGRANSA